MLDSIDTVLFDCDGTLWRGKDILPGSIGLAEKLLERGKRVGYVSNCSTRTHSEMLQDLALRGFPVADPDLVMVTAKSCALYLAEKIPNSLVYLAAPPSLEKELNAVGIKTWTIDNNVADWSEVHPYPDMSQIDATSAVIVGLDRHVTYRRLEVATDILLKKNDCLFVATNMDTTFPEAGGRLAPDCGALAATLSASTRRPVDINIGKPSAIMFEMEKHLLNIDPNRTIMVGDRCETDVEFAAAIGSKSLLVLTGAGTEEDANYYLQTNKRLAPTYISPSTEHFLQMVTGEIEA